MRSFSRYIRRSTANTLAPTFKRINISPITVLAVRNCIWYSIRVVPLSVEKTALVYDVYCKPSRHSSGTPGEEIVALRKKSRSAVLRFEAQWGNGGGSGYVLQFFFLFSRGGFFFRFCFFSRAFCFFRPVFLGCRFSRDALLVAARSMRLGTVLSTRAERRTGLQPSVRVFAVDSILAVPDWLRCKRNIIVLMA